MRATEQAQGQNVYQHGLSVFRYFKRLSEGDTEGFRLPQWYQDHKDDILSNLHNFKTIKHYTTWHDCSKGFVRIIDSEGKSHYPDHAYESWKIFSEACPNYPDSARLILHDMDFHTLSIDEILAQGLSNQDLCTLIVIALCELHSNANLFGGITSTSFIIKWKKLEKLGKKLCEKLFNHAYMYILVRNDLSPAQRAVQGTHAGIEASRKYIKSDDEHPSVIYCVVKNEAKLLKCASELKANGVQFQLFHEPDIQNQATALASQPLIGKDRAVFSRFQLLT